MTTQLSKPHFIKVKDLEYSRSGYNVYVKVVSVENSQTQSNVPFVRAVVADETGAANAFFKGDSAALIQVGKVIAIRNGTLNFIKNKLSLEIDIFGRITPENVEIKETNTSFNISDKEIEKKPRRQPRGEFRGEKKEGEERKPRREGEERRPRREGEERPRREVEERPKREGDFDRRPRREVEERRPRREGEERKPRREGEERPRREEQRGDRRPPVKFTKISAVEPGDEGLNFFAKVIYFVKFRSLALSKSERKQELFWVMRLPSLRLSFMLMSTSKSENQLFCSELKLKLSRNTSKSKFQEKEKLIRRENKSRKSTKK